MTTEAILSEYQSIDMDVTSNSMSHIIEALSLYSACLGKYADGGKTMQSEIEYVHNIMRNLRSEIAKRKKQGLLPFGVYMFNMNAKQLSLVKALLPFLIEKYQRQKDDRLAEGAPVASTEALDAKIEEISKILAWQIMPQLPEYSLLTKKILEPRQAKHEGKGVSITANIHNTGDGVIAVGQDIRIQQSFVSIEKEIQEFLGAVRTSDQLNDEQKEEIEANTRTVQAQLGLKKPNSSIISMAWNSIAAMATADGVAGFVERIGNLLAQHNLLS